jgi:hypothetical protein
MGQAAKRYYSFDADGLLSLATPPRERDPTCCRRSARSS